MDSGLAETLGAHHGPQRLTLVPWVPLVLDLPPVGPGPSGPILKVNAVLYEKEKTVCAFDGDRMLVTWTPFLLSSVVAASHCATAVWEGTLAEGREVRGPRPSPRTRYPYRRGKNAQGRQVPELLLVPAVLGPALHPPVRPGCGRGEGGAARR